MPAWKDVPPELIAECRYLYEETLTPTHEIGARMGLSRTAFYLRVQRWNWQPRRYRHSLAEDFSIASKPDAQSTLQGTMAVSPMDEAAADKVSPEQRPPVATRVSEIVHGQLDLIACIQKQAWPAQPAQAERSARIAALINRSVVEIIAATKSDDEASSDEADDDALPSDPDELRRELAQRIRQFIADRRSSGRGIPDESRGEEA